MDTKTGIVLDEEWLRLFYGRVTAELTLSRNGYTTTHQWVITLTIALITAVLALGKDGPPYPTPFGLIAVLGITPLMVRFFFRSCLEYSIFRRWVTIRNALDYYYFFNPDQTKNIQARQYLEETIRLYYFEWKSSIERKNLLWDTLRMAFLWPLLVLSGLLVWGFAGVPPTPMISGIGLIVGVYVLLEIVGIFRYRGFNWVPTKIKPPKSD